MKRLLCAVIVLILLLTLEGTSTASHPAQSQAGKGSNARLLSIDSPSSNQTSNILVSNCTYLGGNSEVESATDPTNGYVYDLWIGCNGIGFARSTDGGQTFNATMSIPGSLDANGNHSWDPAIAVGGTGIIYASYMLSNSTQGGVPYVAVSHDHGASFSIGRNISTPNALEFSDRDFIALSSNGTIYVTWDYAPNASLVQIQCARGGSCYYTNGGLNIVISHSVDRGKSWSRPVPISPYYPFGGAVSAPLLVEPSGRIDVLYEDYSIGANHFLEQGLNYFTYSTNGGTTWASRIAVGNDSGYLSNTEWWIDGDLSRDGSGTLYASYDTPNSTSENAWLAISNNDGLSWSTPIELSRGDNSSLNIMPGVLGVGATSVYTAWMADYSYGWNALFQVYDKSGVALSKQIAVSNLNGTNGTWGGDTLGIADLNSGAAVSWGYGVHGLIGQNTSEIFSSNIYNITLSGEGGGTIPGQGNNWLRSGSSVPIHAIASSGYDFEGWTTSSQSLVLANSSSANTFLTVFGGGSVTASFNAISVTAGSSFSQSTTTNANSYSVYDTTTAAIGALIIVASVFFIFRRRRNMSRR